jgi:hypothetical protein
MNPLVTQIKEALSADTPRAKPVVLRDRVIKDGIMICPHCNEEIHEKGIATEILGENKMRHTHGKCGGEILLPPPSPEAQEWLDRFKRGADRP